VSVEARVLARLQEHRGRGRDRAVLRNAVQRPLDDELRRRTRRVAADLR